MHNADIMTDMPIGDIVAAHRHSGADVTLLSQHRPTSRHFMFDSTLRLRGWSRADGSASIPAGLDVAGLFAACVRRGISGQSRRIPSAGAPCVGCGAGVLYYPFLCRKLRSS